LQVKSFMNIRKFLVVSEVTSDTWGPEVTSGAANLFNLVAGDPCGPRKTAKASFNHYHLPGDVSIIRIEP
jgi:hypothetical protein